MNTKFYIGCNSAEEEAYFICELNDEEFIAVSKFLDAQTKNCVFGGGYCGHVCIFPDKYDTYEDAKNSAPEYY